jgi:hypothetical protein
VKIPDFKKAKQQHRHPHEGVAPSQLAYTFYGFHWLIQSFTDRSGAGFHSPKPELTSEWRLGGTVECPFEIWLQHYNDWDFFR